MTNQIKTTEGKTYNGVGYIRNTFFDESGKKIRTVTDYGYNGKVARVIEWSGFCSVGRDNAEMYLVKPNTSKARTYKHKENAHAKAIELVMA